MYFIQTLFYAPSDSVERLNKNVNPSVSIHWFNDIYSPMNHLYQSHDDLMSVYRTSVSLFHCFKRHPLPLINFKSLWFFYIALLLDCVGEKDGYSRKWAFLRNRSVTGQ